VTLILSPSIDSNQLHFILCFNSNICLYDVMEGLTIGEAINSTHRQVQQPVLIYCRLLLEFTSIIRRS